MNSTWIDGEGNAQFRQTKYHWYHDKREDYESAVEHLRAAKEKRAAAVSALAVHGLMIGAMDREQRFRLNSSSF